MGDIQAAVDNFAYWHKKAHETPGMLLSNKHTKSDECGEIMNNYMKAIEVLCEYSTAEMAKRM